jgi:hypothetical protein
MKFNNMDIQKKIDDLLQEKDERIKAEIEAHQRIIVIDRTVKSLRRALKDVEEILSDKTEVVNEPVES